MLTDVEEQTGDKKRRREKQIRKLRKEQRDLFMEETKWMDMEDCAR